MKRVIIGLVGLSLLGACGSRVRNWPDEMTIVETTSTTQSQESFSPSTTSASHATTTRSSASGATATTSAPSPLPHPEPGVYRYEVTSDIPGFEGEPATHDTEIYQERWSVSDDAGGLRLVSVDADHADEGSLSTYRVTSSALEYLSDSYSYEGDTYVCNYKPAQTMLKLPLRVGATWHTDSTCTYDDGEVDRVVYDSRVTGRTTDTVGGKTITTFVVEWQDTTTESYPADPEADEEASTDTYITKHTAHVDPNTLLIVREVLKEVEEDGSGGTFIRQLTSMKPR